MGVAVKGYRSIQGHQRTSGNCPGSSVQRGSAGFLKGWLPLLFIALFMPGSTPVLLAQSGYRASDPLDSAMRAVDRGLEFLYRTQADDGGWVSPGYGKTTAVPALAIMALMARGHVPGEGPYADCLERATAFLLNSANDAGLVAGPGSPAAPMYQHGLATLALGELYGMTRRPDIRQRLEAAVGLIIHTQNDAGGWRYQPVKADADMSVTVMQIVALKAAMNAGIKVPQATIDAAIGYVKKSASRGGGFGYTPGGGAAVGASPAGTLSLQMCGEYHSAEVLAGLEHQARQPITYGSATFFYASYYAAQAMNQGGGVYWLEWMPKMRAVLMANQAADGSWPTGSDPQAGSAGPAFSTAIASLILSIDCHYLPIYQR